MGNQDFWNEARWAWDDREIADEDVVRLSKMPCLGCARAYPGVMAPLFIHPCVCGEWHRVCAVCVIQGKLVVGNPKHTSTLGRFGHLQTCPYPLRVANELMGGGEDDTRPVKRTRAQKNLDFAKNYGTGPEIKVPTLRMRTTRLH